MATEEGLCSMKSIYLFRYLWLSILVLWVQLLFECYLYKILIGIPVIVDGISCDFVLFFCRKFIVWFLKLVMRLYTHALPFTPMEESAEKYISINLSVQVLWRIILIHHKPQDSYCSQRKTLAEMMCPWIRELKMCQQSAHTHINYHLFFYMFRRLLHHLHGELFMCSILLLLLLVHSLQLLYSYLKKKPFFFLNKELEMLRSLCKAL